MLVSLAGCGSDGLTTPQRLVQAHEQRELILAGPWSERVNGVRCRMRLASAQVRETERLKVALELWNDSSGIVEVNNTPASMFARATSWSLGSQIFLSESLDAKNLPQKPVRLAPREKFLIGPALLRVTPSVGPRAPAQPISASTLLRAQRLVAPPAMISVTPAQWGSAVNGMRLCVGIDSTTVETNQPLLLFLYIHNQTNDRVMLMTPNWNEPRIQSEDDLITLRYGARHGAAVQRQAPRGIQRRALHVPALFDRPGPNRLRVVLEALPLSSVPKGVWIGTAVSNELMLQVEEPKKAAIQPQTASTAPFNGK